MNDPAARRHQIDLAGADRGKAAHAVAMIDRALEQPGNGGEIDVRVGPHIHPAAKVKASRAELIDEDEWPHHRARFGRQGTAHFELAKIVGNGGDGLFDHEDGPLE